jgi:NRPS condensation-like uncharacterized protein
MKNKIDYSRFEKLTNKAEAHNRSIKYKRFIPINAKEGKVLVFGMYDYKTKRHIVSRPFQDVNKIFDEIEEMLEKA